jgi:GT2 family glycosyltransferase
VLNGMGDGAPSEEASEGGGSRAAPDRRAPLVAVVIVNWNGADDTLEAFASLKSSTHANWRCVVVDNASGDGSQERLRRARDIVLVESEDNLGFAGGCNLGISTARGLGADYVFLLNNDAWVTPDTLAQLVAAARALGDQAALGAVVRYPDGQPQFHGTIKSRWGHSIWLQPSEERLKASPELIPTDFIMGAALLAPMSLFDAIGDLDERFFLNFEEMDWCYRAASHGFGSFVLKEAVVFHKGSASLGTLDSPLQTYFRARNELLYLE